MLWSWDSERNVELEGRERVATVVAYCGREAKDKIDE